MPPAAPQKTSTPTAIAAAGACGPGLKALNAAHGLLFSETQWAAIQSHFRGLKREPTLAELKTLAKIWDRRGRLGPIRYQDGKKTRLIKDLFEETLAKTAARGARSRPPGAFAEQPGIIAFGSKWALALQMRSHSQACAVEPRGGAQAGIGDVVREVMAAGLGAKPVLNSDVFCFAPPDYDGPLPDDCLHPGRFMRCVIGGVRDYGNRMGIPTASGAIWFDPAYRANPLVLCGCVGMLPSWAVRKDAKPGDLIVAAIARAGDRGPESFHEKKLLDAMLAARDRELYRGLTACAEGGLAAALCRLAAQGGAHMRLERIRTQGDGPAPMELWLAESPGRLIFAVPARNLKAFNEIFAAEECATEVLGEFTGTGRLAASHEGTLLVDLDLRFARNAPLPPAVRAIPAAVKPAAAKSGSRPKDLAAILAECLGHLNVCSREWVIRQYDHEAQGGTVIKPLHGIRHDGPGDACVIWPRAVTENPDDFQGFALGHGLNPAWGRLDSYRMALACADEALRNLLCVGADISRAALAASFTWEARRDPAQLGALVRAAEGCRDAGLGFGVPFICGQASACEAPIPGTLLVSALAPVADVRRALTMDIKGPNNPLYLLGWTGAELGGSLAQQLGGLYGCGAVPAADARAAAAAFKAAHAAIAKGLVLSAHDLCEGGLGVCAAEMCFTGEFGAALDLDKLPRRAPIYSDAVLLFSETPSRILLEVSPENEAAFLKVMRGAPLRRVGATMANPVLKVAGLDGRIVLESSLCDLKAAWQQALPTRLP